MNRFKEPGDSQEKGQDRDMRPNWYDTLSGEPGQMSKEPTLAQMRKIKEESIMKNAYAPTRNKGKMALGAIVAAGVIFGGIWGANFAGLLDNGTSNVAQTQGIGQAQKASGPEGSNAGGAVGGGQTSEQNGGETIAEQKASMEAMEVAGKFKHADLEVTDVQREAYVAAFDGGVKKIEDWSVERQKALLPYAEETFLSDYMMNRLAALPCQVAENTDSELMIEGVKMITRSVDLEKQQVVIDYTFDLAFSKDHEPLILKGMFRMQKGEEGWKVERDVPTQASFTEFYNLARPDLPISGS